MRWLELSIEAPGEYAETIAAVFARHADGGVAVEQAGGYNPDEGETPPDNAPVTVKAFLRMDDTWEHRRGQIDLAVRLIGHLYPLPAIQERTVDEDLWRKQTFEPIRVGRHILITPRNQQSERRPGDIVIPLDPGLAFGTGHHPTTRMCLTFIEDLVRPGARVLDVGCGSGILSAAALLLGAQSALGLDIEADAVRSSRDNLEAAGVLERARFIAGSLPNPAAPTGAFDLVFANISSKVLIEMADELLAPVAPDGALIGSGFIVDRRADVEQAFTARGAAISDTAVSGDWVAIVVRPSRASSR